MRFSLLVLVACSAPPAPPLTDPGITYRPPDQQLPDRAKASRIVTAYVAEHAIGTAARPPTDAELAAARDADPVDGISRSEWNLLPPASRLQRAYDIAQRAAWDAICQAGVAAWWQAALTIDDEMGARLVQPAPADFYAGMAEWSGHRAWLAQRTRGDAAFQSLPLATTGAYHRLNAAQLAWAATWRDGSLEHAYATLAVDSDGWPLDPRDEEQARLCEKIPRSATWPPKLTFALRPQAPRPLQPVAQEAGVVVKVDASHQTVRIAWRDAEETRVWIQPCKAVACVGIDCGMTPEGPWLHPGCKWKMVHLDHARTVHFTSPPPVLPKLGDHVVVAEDENTGEAVLSRAARTADGPAYFTLSVY